MKTVLIAIIGTYYNAISYISKSYATKNVILLFSRPRKGRITEEQEDFLGSAFQEELQFENHSIMTYRWLGKKETILLVHGWESNSGRWKNLIITLKRKGYNIVALDAPAHGHSGSKVFNVFLYSKFIGVAVKHFQPTIIVAHSVGGMATSFCLKNQPLNRLQKLVLIGAPSEFSKVLYSYTHMMGYNQRIINELDTFVLERYGAEPSSFSTAKYLSDILSKGLLIHDEDDPIIPYKDALQIQECFKDSQLITTKGMGHSLNNDIVSNYICEFIET